MHADKRGLEAGRICITLHTTENSLQTSVEVVPESRVLIWSRVLEQIIEVQSLPQTVNRTEAVFWKEYV